MKRDLYAYFSMFKVCNPDPGKKNLQNGRVEQRDHHVAGIPGGGVYRSLLLRICIMLQIYDYIYIFV